MTTFPCHECGTLVPATLRPVHLLVYPGEELMPCPDCLHWSVTVASVCGYEVTACEWHDPGCAVFDHDPQEVAR